MIESIQNLFQSITNSLGSIMHEASQADPHLLTFTIFFSLAIVLVAISINGLEKDIKDIQEKMEEDIKYYEQKDNSDNEHNGKTSRE